MVERPGLLSIVIVNWNTCELVRDCLNALGPPEGIVSEVIVVDNDSHDGSPAMLQREFPHVQLISNAENAGFARANNQGIRASHGQYVLLLNSDTLASADALQALVTFMQDHSDAGACGPRLLRTDGTPQPYAYGCDPTLGYLLARGLNRLLWQRYLHDWSTEQIQAVDWVSGACLMVRRAAIDQAGLLDEKLFMYFEDSEWCLRIRQAGWKVYYHPGAEIVHLGGQSLARNPSARRAYAQSLQYVYAKHYGRLAGWLLRAGRFVYQRLVRYD